MLFKHNWHDLASRALIALLVILFLWLQYDFWLSARSVRTERHVVQQLSLALANNAKLQVRNDAMYQKVLALKHDPKTIESMARVDLGLIKQGETYFQFQSGTAP